MEERIARKLAQEDRKPNSNNNKTGMDMEKRIARKVSQDATTKTSTLEDRTESKLASEDRQNFTIAAAGTTRVVATSANYSSFKVDQEEEKEEIEHATTTTAALTKSTNLYPDIGDRIQRKLAAENNNDGTNKVTAVSPKSTATISTLRTSSLSSLEDRIKIKMSDENNNNNNNNATNNNPIKGEEDGTLEKKLITKSSFPDDIINNEKDKPSMLTQMSTEMATVPSTIFDEEEGYHNNTTTATTVTTSTAVAPIDEMYTAQPMYSEPPLRVNNYGVGNYGEQPSTNKIMNNAATAVNASFAVNASYTAVDTSTDDYHDDGIVNNEIAGFVVQEALTLEGEIYKKKRCNGLFSGYTKRQMIFGSIFIVLIMSLAIALSIIFGNGSSSGTQKTYAPTNVPTLQPTPFRSYAPSTDVYKDFASQTGLLPSNTSLLQMVGSPQYEALQWINSENKLSIFASNDTMNNTTNTTNGIIPNMIDPDNKEYIALIQRYVLAVFYHSTNGDNWKVCSTSEKKRCSGTNGVEPWLTEYHECTWFGVRCNDDNLVTKLLLGTLCF